MISPVIDEKSALEMIDFIGYVLKKHPEILVNDHGYTYKGEKEFQETKMLPEDFFTEVELNLTIEDLKEILGQGIRTTLPKMAAFVDVYKHSTSRKHVSEIVCATTSEKLIGMLGCISNVRNLRRKLIESYLLKLSNGKVHWNEDGTPGKAKNYGYNKHVEDLILELMKEYEKDEEVQKSYSMYLENFEKSLTFSAKDFTHVDIVKATEKVTGFNFGFSSKLRLSKNLSEDEVMALLFERYPQLEYYSKIIEEANKYLDEANKVKFIPNIHRSKSGFITKIGIRATNSLVSLKAGKFNEKTGEFDPNERKEYLDNYFGEGNYVTYDVKSSIYRVAYLVRNGVWAPSDIDFYLAMYSDEIDFRSKDCRDWYKNLCMRFYFDTEGQLFHHLEPIARLLYGKFSPNQIRYVLKMMKGRMTRRVGESLDSEIFLHESCIYARVAQRLRAMGLKVVQIYDGFYFDKGIEVDMDKLVEECAIEYYDMFIKDKGVENA